MIYVFADYELDEQLYQLSQAGEPLELERKVFDVLAYLVQHHDRLVTKEELLEKLWPEQVVGEAALTRCITSARKALGDDGNRQEFIKTQYGRGYRFVAAVAAPVSRSTFQLRKKEVVGRRKQIKRQMAKIKRRKWKRARRRSPSLRLRSTTVLRTQLSAPRTCPPQCPGASGQDGVSCCSESWGLWSGSLLLCLPGLPSALSPPHSALRRRRSCRCPTNPRSSCFPSSI